MHIANRSSIQKYPAPPAPQFGRKLSWKERTGVLLATAAGAMVLPLASASAEPSPSTITMQEAQDSFNKNVELRCRMRDKEIDITKNPQCRAMLQKIVEDIFNKLGNRPDLIYGLANLPKWEVKDLDGKRLGGTPSFVVEVKMDKLNRGKFNYIGKTEYIPIGDSPKGFKLALSRDGYNWTSPQGDGEDLVVHELTHILKAIQSIQPSRVTTTWERDFLPGWTPDDEASFQEIKRVEIPKIINRTSIFPRYTSYYYPDPFGNPVPSTEFVEGRNYPELLPKIVEMYMDSPEKLRTYSPQLFKLVEKCFLPKAEPIQKPVSTTSPSSIPKLPLVTKNTKQKKESGFPWIWVGGGIIIVGGLGSGAALIIRSNNRRREEESKYFQLREARRREEEEKDLWL